MIGDLIFIIFKKQPTLVWSQSQGGVELVPLREYDSMNGGMGARVLQRLLQLGEVKHPKADSRGKPAILLEVTDVLFQTDSTD